MAKINVFSSVFITLFLATFTFYLADATVPSIYLFGDSQVDVGTQTLLPEGSPKADHAFYGIDSPRSKPNGRFNNGLNLADYLAKLMGFKRSPPPYLSLISQSNGLMYNPRGVNFASGGAGVLDSSAHLPKVVQVSMQIEQFIEVKKILTAAIGRIATEEMLSKSFFCISIGGKEMVDHFLNSSTVPPQQVITAQMNQYEKYIKALYNHGARKFGLISVSAIGCCPGIRLYNTTGGCVDSLNDFSQAFHSALHILMSRLNSKLEEMKYAIGNTYETSINIIDNPLQFNITDVETACCGAGKLNAEVRCNATTNLCTNRENYVYWDTYQYTQICAQLTAARFFDGPTRVVSPINFRQLVEEK